MQGIPLEVVDMEGDGHHRGEQHDLSLHISCFVCLFVCLFVCFLAVLGLCFCARAFSSCSERGPLFIEVRGPLLLRSTGSRRAGSVIVAHGPSCSAACGICPDQGSNPCPLHWQVDSQPLSHQGSPPHQFLNYYLDERKVSYSSTQWAWPTLLLPSYSAGSRE